MPGFGGTGGRPVALANGLKEVASNGTAVALVASVTYVDWILISPEGGNTDNVAIGISTVVAADGATIGLVLYPGGPPVLIQGPLDIKTLFVDSIVNAEGVSFLYQPQRTSGE